MDQLYDITIIQDGYIVDDVGSGGGGMRRMTIIVMNVVERMFVGRRS